MPESKNAIDNFVGRGAVADQVAKIPHGIVRRSGRHDRVKRVDIRVNV
jgi:hypothetical protein